MILLTSRSRLSRSMETGSRLAVTRGWEERAAGRNYLMGTECFSGAMKNLEGENGDGRTRLRMHEVLVNCPSSKRSYEFHLRKKMWGIENIRTQNSMDSGKRERCGRVAVCQLSGEGTQVEGDAITEMGLSRKGVAQERRRCQDA